MNIQETYVNRTQNWWEAWLAGETYVAPTITGWSRKVSFAVIYDTWSLQNTSKEDAGHKVFPLQTLKANLHLKKLYLQPMW